MVEGDKKEHQVSIGGMREPQDRSMQALPRNSRMDEELTMLENELVDAKTLIEQRVAMKDPRVPRKKEELVWRLALYLRHQTHIIRVLDQKV